MSLVVVVLLAALVVGRLRGGSLDRLEQVALRRPGLVVAALGVQAAGTLLGGPLHAAGLAASALLVTGFLVLNREVRGTGLVALGLAANALVVGLNGAMPVSPEAAARAGVDPVALLDARHELAAGRTRLLLLGDVVPVPLPLRPEVVSPGDVLVAAGLGQLLVLGMSARPPAAGRTVPRGGSAGGRRDVPGPPVRPAVQPAVQPLPSSVRPEPAPEPARSPPRRRSAASPPPSRRRSEPGRS